MYGADPRLEDLGSKTGCRRMFEELGVRCPVGAEDLHTVDDIVAGVQSMRARRPSLSQAIVKLNEGVSGAGNAMVDLSGLPAPGSPDEAAAIKDRLLRMQPESEKLDCRRLSGRLREARRHRRGADHRRSADQSECPDAGVARRHRRAAVHPRPASRWRERSEVPRLRVPGQSRLRRGHRRARHGDRKTPRRARRARPVRGGFRCGARRKRARGRPTRSS